MVRIRLSILIVIVALLAAACGGAASPTNAPAAPTLGGETGGPATGADTAVAAVQGFYAALYGGGDLSTYVCSTTPEFADALRQASEASAQAFANATINLEGLTYTASNESDTEATVTVEGQIVYSMSGTDTPVPYGPVPHRVVNEDGAWKVCG